METRQMPVKLAMRREGDMWCAYLMANFKEEKKREPLLLGSIRIIAVEQNEERKQQFMDMMTSFMGEMIELVTGKTPDRFEVQPAPENERSGNA
jgi:hypothetical protein